MVLLAIAGPSFGGYISRKSWIPIAGHATGFGGRTFYTTIYLTDVSGTMNDITISFFASAQPHAPPRSASLQLGPNLSGAVEVGPQLTGDAGATGAIRIHSSARLFAEARIYSRAANEPPGAEVGEVVDAIPSHDAIGTDESAILHVPPGSPYKLYAVETDGFPLYFSVRTDHAERRLYLSPNEHRSWDLNSLFPGAQPSSLRLTGINGSGKIIAAGSANEPISADFHIYEMSLRTDPRHRMPRPEIVGYVVVGLAIASSAIYALKKR